MKIVNNTPARVRWNVTSPAGTDCGYLEPKSATEYSTQPNLQYRVSFTPESALEVSAEGIQTVTLALTVT